jgi:DNA-binding response OmpR family regulator
LPPENSIGRQLTGSSTAADIRHMLLREVRASPELSQTPFIMITAESKTENVIAAKKAGVSNYIVKPFNAATLKT